MDLFEKLEKNMGPLGMHADKAEGYYVFPHITGKLSSRMMFNNKEVVMWSINNYLGLGHRPDVIKVDADATAEYGLCYPMGSRMMSGNTQKHEDLEKELAEFVGKEDAVLLNFGYQGIMSAIDCLIGRNDVVVYDAECHACIVDGVRMHPGKRFVYIHNDMESLEKNLNRATALVAKTGGAIMVITEGVYGMRGDQGKLKEVVALKKDYDFRLMVDDAHGFGTLGKTGAGAGEEQGVQDEIDIYFATFAKSMASIGAFLASKKHVVKYMKYNMRSQIFAKSLPMPFVIGAKYRLKLLKENPELKDNLWKIVNMLQDGLKEAGFDTGDTNSCVTPVYLKGTIPDATQLTYDLRENYGIFCSIVVYPVIPKGMIILRLIPTAYHTAKDVEETIAAFKSVRKKLDAGAYSKEFMVAQ